MASSQPPVGHWTLHNEQVFTPENIHIQAGDSEPFFVLPPNDLSLPDCQPQNKSHYIVPGLAAWHDWAAAQPFLASQEPDFLTLQSPGSTPNGLLDSLDQPPGSWDWTALVDILLHFLRPNKPSMSFHQATKADINSGNMENMNNASLCNAAQNQFGPPLTSDFTNDDVTMEDAASSTSSQTHGYLASISGPSCQECGLRFTNKTSLNIHSKKTRHSPYLCKCAATFSRLDVLERHVKAYTSDVTISCPYCQTNPKSFGRQDHLTQHLRGFHSMDIVTDGSHNQHIRPIRKLKKKIYCLHVDCWDLEDSEGSSSPLQRRRRSFQTQSHYTSHLRKVHDESLFPCTAVGCARKGGKGFFRSRDLVKHTRDHHSRSPS